MFESDLTRLLQFDVIPIMISVIFNGVESLFVELGKLREATVIQAQQTCFANVRRSVPIAVTNQQLVNSGLESGGKSEPVFIRVIFKAQPTAQRGDKPPAAGLDRKSVV